MPVVSVSLQLISGTRKGVIPGMHGDISHFAEALLQFGGLIWQHCCCRRQGWHGGEKKTAVGSGIVMVARLVENKSFTVRSAPA